MEIDFEGNGAVATKPNGEQQSNSGAGSNAANQPDTTNLNGGDVTDINSQKPDTKPNTESNGTEGSGDNNANLSMGGLEPGTELEVDGVSYTVDDSGNIVDKEGKVFKEAKDVESWLKENNISDSTDNNELTIDSIRESVGIDVTDENGNPVEFTNDSAGVKAYLDAVRNLQANDIAQGAINKLFTDNPMLKQFIDYVEVTGSPKGFGDIPDRSNIKLDKDNQSQQEAIIRIAAKEFGNKTVTDTYIKYLKDSGALYDEAKLQLEALVGKDKAYRAEVEQRAKAIREQQEEEIRNYWQSVNDAINKKVIGGYKLPDSIVREVNGQKVTYTLNDFFNYLSQPVKTDDESVITGYQRDLAKLSDEETLNRELLDAWLMFTGGSYKDLIDMAVKEDNVRKLIIKSKEQRAAHNVKIVKPKANKVDFNNLVLG